MRKQSLFVKLCLTANLVFFASLGVNAQVTVGSNNPPSPWSLLYLDAREQQRALHNARLTTDQRNALVTTDSPQTAQDDAMGLLLFNTETQCLEFWNGSQWVSLCRGDIPRVNFPEDEITISGNLTAWTNVMYDFQTQRLWIPASWTADVANNGNFQWQVSTGGNRWFSIRGETNADFIVPVDFMYDVDNIRELAWVKGNFPQDPELVDNSRELYFRRVQTLSDAITATNPFNMFFIRTNTSGFSQEADITLRSLTMNRGGTLNGGLINVALLNLGATADNSLGDFFQWGRRADGHHAIVWEKNPIPTGANVGANRFGPGTSGHVARPVVDATNFNMTTGQPISDTRFFTANNTVANWSIADQNLWGDGSTGRPGTGWTFGHNNTLENNNNPCPAGWRVPSHFEWWDMHNGNGITTNPTSENNSWGVTTSGNTWRWRGVQTGTGAVGGALVMNAKGQYIFLPAVGVRANPTANLAFHGTYGNYWSSGGQSAHNSFDLRFNANGGARHTHTTRALGKSVRCVAE